jgi:hypothetical protein
MKATTAGRVIGKALENWDPATPKDKVMVLVSPSWWDPDLSLTDTGNLKSALADAARKVARLDITGDGGLAFTDTAGTRMMVFDNSGNATIFGTLTVDRLIANHIEGLDVMVNRLVTESLEIIGNASESAAIAQITPIPTYATSSGSITGQISAIVADMQVKGKTIFENVVEVFGQVTFKNLVTFLTDAIFKGNVKHEGNVAFEKEASFSGSLTLPSNMAGEAVISSYATRVDVLFDQLFATKPVVTITLAFDEATQSAFLADAVKAAVSNVSEYGFSIVIDQMVPQDLTYNWVAVAVQGRKRTVSGSPEEFLLGAQASSSAEATISGSFTPESSMSATVSSVIPTPTSTPTLEPTLIPTSTIVPDWGEIVSPI